MIYNYTVMIISIITFVDVISCN